MSAPSQPGTCSPVPRASLAGRRRVLRLRRLRRGPARQPLELPGDEHLLPAAARRLVAALIAVPLGLIALRVRRHTFVVITIAFFFIFQLIAFNLSFTGGNQGVSSPFFLWSASTYNNPFYYVGLVIAVATIVLSWLIRNSRVGLQLLAIRDDEDRARGSGCRPCGSSSPRSPSRRDRRHDRRTVVVLHRPGAARDRVQPLVRPDRGADGLPGRVRHPRQPGARRADPGAAPAVDRDHLHQRLHQRHRAGCALPGRHLVPAARDRPDRDRVPHPVACRAGAQAREHRRRGRPAGQSRRDPDGRAARQYPGHGFPGRRFPATGSPTTGSPTTGTPSTGGAR